MPADVRQGALGDCFLLAAMADCASVDKGRLLRELIVTKHADVGLYGVKLYLNGAVRH